MGHERSGPDSKATSLRWVVLIPFILYVAALIAVSEIVSRRFPSSDDVYSAESNGTFPTALFSAPLINARSPSPTATYLPSKAKTQRSENGQSYHRHRRQQQSANGTENSQEPSMTSLNYHNMPDTNEGQNGVGLGSTNVTEVQQKELAWADKTGQPVEFAARLARPPTGINGSRPGNDTWKPVGRRLRPRLLDPSDYAQFSGPTQIIQPLINIFSDANGVAYEGASWISYAGGDPTDPNFAAACWATCNGPAIVFHHRYCWEEWVWYAALEQEARMTNPNLAWKVVEDTYSGGSICGSASGRVVPDPANPDNKQDTPGSAAKSSPMAKVVTLSDAAGNPTGVVTRVEVSAGPLATTITLRDTTGSPTATIVAAGQSGGGATKRVVLTNSNGIPTSTLTLGPLTHTLRNEQGTPTATVTLGQYIPGQPLTLTLTNSAGVPTFTTTISPGGDIPGIFGSGSSRPQPTSPPQITNPLPGQQVHLISNLEYALASFLPVLLATPLCILAQSVNSKIREYLPFHTLLRQGGVSVGDSLTLPAEGIAGLATSVKLLIKYHDLVPFLADFLTVLGAVISALSSEAVGIRLYGKCTADSFRGCYMGIAVFGSANLAVEVLLCVMLVGLVLLGVLLRKWEVGVGTTQKGKGVTSIAATAGLLGHYRTREVLREVMTGDGVGKKEINKRLAGWKFGLGYFATKNEEDSAARGYGIIVTREGEDKPKDGELEQKRSTARYENWKKPLRQPTAGWKALSGILFLCGLVVLIICYETMQTNPEFKRFMLAQNFGARILFTALGIVIAWFWDGYFASKSPVALSFSTFSSSSSRFGFSESHPPECP